jgi:hypothetical protein
MRIRELMTVEKREFAWEFSQLTCPYLVKWEQELHKNWLDIKCTCNKKLSSNLEPTQSWWALMCESYTCSCLTQVKVATIISTRQLSFLFVQVGLTSCNSCFHLNRAWELRKFLCKTFISQLSSSFDLVWLNTIFSFDNCQYCLPSYNNHYMNAWFACYILPRMSWRLPFSPPTNNPTLLY